MSNRNRKFDPITFIVTLGATIIIVVSALLVTHLMTGDFSNLRELYSTPSKTPVSETTNSVPTKHLAEGAEVLCIDNQRYIYVTRASKFKGASLNSGGLAKLSGDCQSTDQVILLDKD